MSWIALDSSSIQNTVLFFMHFYYQNLVLHVTGKIEEPSSSSWSCLKKHLKKFRRKLEYNYFRVARYPQVENAVNLWSFPKKDGEEKIMQIVSSQVQKLGQRLLRKVDLEENPEWHGNYYRLQKNIQKKEIWRKVKKKISIFEKGLKKENRLHLPTWIMPECPQHRNSGVKKKCINSPKE